jgi:hypothetical protein
MGYPNWEAAWLLFDEDDDDCRWEEMFSIHEDGSFGGQDLRYFADKIGDRWEMDSDFSGCGKLYVGKFDGRIHLYGAEKGEWRIDYYSLFKYIYDEPPFGPVPPEGLRYDRVRYFDTDGNGFIDRIEYSAVEFGREDTTEEIRHVVDLRRFGDDADVCDVIDPRVDAPLTGWKFSVWDGRPLSLEEINAGSCGRAYAKMKELYRQVADQMWARAIRLFEAARSTGLTAREGDSECAVGPEWIERPAEERLGIQDITMRQGYAGLTAAKTLREKYHRGYWLREKVFTDILWQASETERETLCRLYYTGRIDELCEVVRRR